MVESIVQDAGHQRVHAPVSGACAVQHWQQGHALIPGGITLYAQPEFCDDSMTQLASADGHRLSSAIGYQCIMAWILQRREIILTSS